MNAAGQLLIRAAVPGLWFCSLQAGAQAVPPEFQVNTTTTADQFDSAVAALADGRFVVAWHDANSATAKAQRFTATGSKVGGQITVPAATGTMPATSAIGPRVAGLVNGGAVVAWTGNEDDVADQASASGVAAQVFDGNFVKLGTQSHVNTTTAGRQTVGGVAPLSNGGFVVTWESAPLSGATGQDGSGRGVYARRFNADGSSASAEFRVNTTTSGDQKQPRIAALANGGFVVVWMDDGAFTFKAQRYSSGGGAVGGEIEIGGSAENTAVAGLDDGGFVAIWTGVVGDVGNEACVRQFNANGVAVTFEFQANTYNTGTQRSSAVAGLANGGYVVLWSSAAQDGSLSGVYGQKFTPASFNDGAEFRVNVHTADAQAEASVAALGNGFVATWSSDKQDGSEGGIYARLYGDTGGDGAVITGTSGPDDLTGTSGDDTIDGKGSADVMTGLGGNDIYIVNNTADAAVEIAGEGTDTVKSAVSYTLPAYVEKLLLIGTAASNATGNGLNNTLTGNDASNVLDGKAGADQMYGRAGNDTYYVDNAGDTVVEPGGPGIDTVRSSLTYALPRNVENLVLIGAAAINGTGNSLANRITGNGAGNVLNGGPGNDTLVGGGGPDRFLFKNGLDAATNVDGVASFDVVDDGIRLDNAVFTALTATGRLAATAFRVGATAAKTTHRIVYNPTTGALLYDADGTGPTAAVRFATLPAGLALTNANIVVQ